MKKFKPKLLLKKKLEQFQDHEMQWLNLIMQEPQFYSIVNNYETQKIEVYRIKSYKESFKNIRLV